MTGAILYPLLCACAYYLGAAAKITAWLWSRYPRGFDEFMVCPACSGFWYGLACAGVGAWLRLDFLGLPPRSGYTWLLVALCAIVWTPLVSRLHLASLHYFQQDLDPEGYTSSSEDGDGP